MNDALVKTEEYEVIESKIFVCRETEVMLDSDVANYFNVETETLNQQIERNKVRFPEDFCFQLNSIEFKNLRSQNATSNNISSRRYNPYVYTEHAILALAAILNNDYAIEASIKIARAFTSKRDSVMQRNKNLLELIQLEERMISFEIETKKRLEEIIKVIGASQDIVREIKWCDYQLTMTKEETIFIRNI